MDHGCNLAINIGGTKSAMGARSQGRKWGKISLNQSLIYINPFPPSLIQFLFSPFQLNSQKKTVLKYKIY
jgi:hypothetical protein